jgi:hypothetical protein
MAKKKNQSWTASQAGNKTAARAQQSPSWSLKTRCRELTVLDYIRLVCEDDLTVLVASGKPLDRDLDTARADVLAEFAELSGASDGGGMALFNEIYAMRAQRVSYLAAMSAMGELFEDGREFFRSKGFDVSGWTAEEPRKWLKRINGEIKAIDGRMALKVKEYNKMAAQNEGKKATEADIRLEMVILASDLSHSIADDCNLATYAAYKKAHRERVKALEMVKSKQK